MPQQFLFCWLSSRIRRQHSINCPRDLQTNLITLNWISRFGLVKDLWSGNSVYQIYFKAIIVSLEVMKHATSEFNFTLKSNLKLLLFKQVTNIRSSSLNWDEFSIPSLTFFVLDEQNCSRLQVRRFFEDFIDDKSLNRFFTSAKKTVNTLKHWTFKLIVGDEFYDWSWKQQFEGP